MYMKTKKMKFKGGGRRHERIPQRSPLYGYEKFEKVDRRWAPDPVVSTEGRFLWPTATSAVLLINQEEHRHEGLEF